MEDNTLNNLNRKSQESFCIKGPYRYDELHKVNKSISIRRSAHAR